MTTKTRYQEWVEYHVLDWQRKLAKAEEYLAEAQERQAKGYLKAVVIRDCLNDVARCRRKLAYWEQRLKP